MFAGSAGVHGQGSQRPAHGRPQCVGPQENSGSPRTALQGALITTAGDQLAVDQGAHVRPLPDIFLPRDIRVEHV